MIKIVFFAALREQLNCSELSLDTKLLSSENITTVADIKKLLSNKSDAWSRIFSNSSLLSAVNHDMVTSDNAVAAGDEVAFFPPVTGG